MISPLWGQGRGGSAVPRIKIVSNPFEQMIRYYLKKDDGWISIPEAGEPNSCLLNKGFVTGFFPFKVHDIVNALLREYGSAEEKLKLEFEGPDDEWDELRQVCSIGDFANRVELFRGDRYLSNGRDILPLLRDEFDLIDHILQSRTKEGASSGALLERFKEASGKNVPVCVVGNYSSGKSSFINSLIGLELLPNGDRPVTAKVFRISNSQDPSSARITFGIASDKIRVIFSENETHVRSSDEVRSVAAVLFRSIEDAGKPGDGVQLVERVRAVLVAINECDFKEFGDVGSGIVEVNVPFASTDWMHCHNFVIFDTPGSNSNSNRDHLEALQHAMRNMSDGLPVFVSTFDSLDSNDNADLYGLLEQNDALDERFAMVVVNKADNADLPEGGFDEATVRQVKGYAAVKNLYAHGVYFVSSIMGLGAKVEGKLNERHYDRVYRQQFDSYSDPEDRFYIRLYDYDILPDQIKWRVGEEAATCPERVLANSGLYSIERTIEDFAVKYSVYNKCSRAYSLLSELVEISDRALQGEIAIEELNRDKWEDELGSSKQEVLGGLELRSRELGQAAIDGAESHMERFPFLQDASLSGEQIAVWEDELVGINRAEGNLAQASQEAQRARSRVSENFARGISDVWEKRDILGMVDVAAKLFGDIGAAHELGKDERGLIRRIDDKTSTSVLERSQEHFDRKLDEALVDVERASSAYWADCARSCRDSLLEFVTDSKGLSEEKRIMLRDIILDFRALQLEGSRAQLMDIRVPFVPEKLWKSPLIMQYQIEMGRRIKKWKEAVLASHGACFSRWLADLTAELSSNIVDLNPELRKQFGQAESARRKIDSLNGERRQLMRAIESVSGYMSWHGGE